MAQLQRIGNRSEFSYEGPYQEIIS